MPQAVWTGALAFGLVSIPVKLYGATSPRDVRFHQFEGRTGRRVRYRRTATEADVPLWEGSQAPWPEGSPGPGHTAAVPSARAPEPGPDPDAGRQPDPDSGSGAGATGAEEAGGARTALPEEVAFEDVVRGFEVDPGRFVRVTDEELAELAPEPSRSIDIEDFVRLDEIDPVYFEKSYRLVPGRGAERTYRLLVRAMEESGRVAIGRFVLRTREHLAAIRPSGGSLMLETLFRADEVRDAAELGIRPVEEPSDREVEVAVRLIEALATEWDPSRYPDTYRERVLDLIRGKAGRRPEMPATEAGAGPAVVDLMEALKRSVEEARRARGKSPRDALPKGPAAKRRRETG